MNYSNHPRPQLERSQWRDLCGTWRFAFDEKGAWHTPSIVTFDKEILVPYCPESPASGIADQGYHNVVWYAKTIELEPKELPQMGQRLLVHFGAVDYEARVWANGQLVAQHRGGHTPFVADITEAIQDNQVEIVVQAKDDPLDLAKPRGKQDWQVEPHEIWYPRTTGIWQPVWLELVPETRLDRVIWTPHLDRWEIGFEAQLTGPLEPDMWVQVRLLLDDQQLAFDRYSVSKLEVARRITLPDPGIDDFRNELLWTPHHPRIIQAEIELVRMIGQDVIVLDRVQSYTALRSVSLSDHRLLINGRPYFLRMVLDQGYWPNGIMTATDEELRFDVEMTKRLGFNSARKHQKIENPRWLYWCDVLGLMVWEEMPSPYRFTAASVSRLTEEWVEAIERDRSHPCIVGWVPFNESWGVPDLPSNPAHRDYVSALYHLTKTLDPTRPVIGNDGWETVATDIVGIHDYENDPTKIYDRYKDVDTIKTLLERQQPGGRPLAVGSFRFDEHPVVLSECGGIAYAPKDEKRGWGYSRVSDETTFLSKYTALCETIFDCTGLTGFCYTQLTDTYQEKNGILYADRTPKADLLSIFTVTRGERTAWENDVYPDPDPMGYSDRWKKHQEKMQQRRQV
jgi:beta-galactosidase/beta-glucuronidase